MAEEREKGKLGVVFDEQAGQICVGILNEGLDEVVEIEDDDVTATAVVAVADYVFARGGAVEFSVDADTTFEVQVVKVGKMRDGSRVAILPGAQIVGLADD